MQARLSFASILLLTASSAWLALAQQSSQTGAFMSDRDKAGLRGPVKTVLEEQTFSGADGQQSFTTTTTQYAPEKVCSSSTVLTGPRSPALSRDRKSTRLNSSHRCI